MAGISNDVRRCATCASPCLPMAHFCAHCGALLAASASTGSQDAAAEPERKHATVLFADMVGSTELIRGLDPEQAMAACDR